MHYEINVSKDGVHLFATHERSLQENEKALALFKEFQFKFPSIEGYKLQMYKYEDVGRFICGT